MSKLKLAQLQFALFFDAVENRPDRLANKVEDVLGEIFNQMPTIIPLPSDAPSDVPAVIMQSSDGNITCNVSRSRIDLLMNKNYNDSISVGLEESINLIKTFISAIYSYKNIVRFGLIGRYFCEENDPVNKIKSKYICNGLTDLDELTIKFNKKFLNNGYTFNDLVEINNGVININGVNQNVIFIQRDMNNIPVNILPLEEVTTVLTSNLVKFYQSGILELIE